MKARTQQFVEFIIKKCIITVSINNPSGIIPKKNYNIDMVSSVKATNNNDTTYYENNDFPPKSSQKKTI